MKGQMKEQILGHFLDRLYGEFQAFKAEMLSALLQQKNILSGLYDSWLKKDDSQYGELESHVLERMEHMADTEKRTA